MSRKTTPEEHQTPKLSGLDRRAFRRQLFGLTCLVADPKGTLWPAQGRDISRGGVGLFAFREFSPGTVLTVEFGGRQMCSRVIQSKADKPGDWLLRCAFTNSLELTEAELEALLGSSPRAVRRSPMLNFDPFQRMQERRISVRYPCELEAVCRPSAGHPDGQSCPAKVRNISAGGLSLLLAQHFDPGTLLDVVLEKDQDDVPRIFPTRVVQAMPLRFGGWMLRCAFADRLSEAAFRALLGT